MAALIVTIIFGSITASFSFFAYILTKERFRLELLEKRWDIYENTLKFCGAVLKHGGIPKHSDDENLKKEIVDLLMHAESSFRGIGFHKSKSLFDPEINEHFDKINEAYAWFVKRNQSGNWHEKEYENLILIHNTVNKLPELFKPYVYF